MSDKPRCSCEGSRSVGGYEDLKSAVRVGCVFALAALILGACASQASRAAQTSPLRAPAPAPEADTETAPKLRLPEDTRPLGYRLRLRVDPTASRFEGQVRMEVELSAPRETLWLHAQRLSAERAVVIRPDGVELAARLEIVDAEQGLAALRLDTPLAAGRAEVVIDYSGAFGEHLRGLYRVRQGEDAYAFTQFEPLSAREAFPCFDEPRFKTPFEVQLVVPEGQVAIANTLETGVKSLEGGQVEHTFAATQPLPTYLLAWAVGPLEVVEAPALPKTAVRDVPVPFRGVAVRGRGKDLAYALERTPAMVEVLEGYFGIAYPYDKLDVIAVPDFGAGAMENAGAITFRESLLLMNEDSSGRQQQSFANVMAHELAHQWFGNLVTMPFWEDLWLNEAFASWMAARVVSELYPAYHAQRGELRDTHYAMGMDEKSSARSIRQPIESSHDIHGAFDGITYSKGAAVLAMFEGYLGEARFREGLRLYMRAHAWGSATAEDLLAALEKASGEPVSEAFSSFLNQPGVPLVSVEPLCEGGQVRVRLSQRRFVPVGGPADAQTRWSLPVCLRYEADGKVANECVLLSEAQAEYTLPARSCPTWWMPNAGAQGYYYWSLPQAQLGALSDRGWPALSAAERQSVAENLGASLRAGATTPTDVFPLLLELMADADRHMLVAAHGPLDFADTHLLEAGQRKAYRARLRKLLAPRLREVGFVPAGKGEEGERALLRRTLVWMACEAAKDPACRKFYLRAGLSELGLGDARRPSRVTADLVPTALRVAVVEGGEAAFARALERFSSSQDAVERANLLRALAACPDPERGERALALTLDARLRVNEVMIPLWVQASTEGRREATWQWVLEHLPELQKKLPGRRAGRLVSLASGFCSAQWVETLRAQFAERAELGSGGPRELSNAIEGVELCTARAGQQRASARAFFAGHGGARGARAR